MENKGKIINKRTVLSFFSGVLFTLLMVGVIFGIYSIATSNKIHNSNDKADFLTFTSHIFSSKDN